MSELMPEKRLDSNGKLVTRWVKPADATAGNRTPLPPVKMNQSKHASISKKLKQAAVDQYISIPESINMDAVTQRIDALPNDSAEFIHGLLEGVDDDSLLNTILISTLDADYPPAAVEDIAFLYASMDPEQQSNISDYTSWSKRGFDATIIIKDSLAGCSAMKLDNLNYDYGVVPLRLNADAAISKAAAYYSVVDCIEGEFADQSALIYGKDKEALFHDPELALFIINNHERASDIVDLMRTLGTTSLGRIKEVMETESKALWGGVL